MRKIRLLFLGFVACCRTAEAVVIASGGPNNTALSGPQNSSNVGTLSGASATFLLPDANPDDHPRAIGLRSSHARHIHIPPSSPDCARLSCTPRRDAA